METINSLVFNKEIHVNYSEMDYNLVLKPSALLNYLQDLASDNAEVLGFGYSTTYPKNLGWFLLKYRMEFEEYPQSLYDIRMETEARGYNKLFAHRDFKIFDKEKCLGKISSVWSLVDLSTKQLLHVEKTLDTPNLRKHEKRIEDLTFEKIPEITHIDIQKEFEIRFDDIDVNQHVNNCNYIIWAFEPLDFTFRSQKKLKTLDIVYKKEIQYGNKILSLVEIQGNTTIHNLKNAQTGEDLCQIKAEWK
ncbi:MAG: thioesterase [Clostridiaceae bacterium]|jgi:medium-chain acyl-[acyl-carrier-protein] hydrolase|nr:thioesterase [Clostridiaceae bacterium]